VIIVDKLAIAKDVWNVEDRVVFGVSRGIVS
jgi:hypothetical protein